MGTPNLGLWQWFTGLLHRSCQWPGNILDFPKYQNHRYVFLYSMFCSTAWTYLIHTLNKVFRWLDMLDVGDHYMWEQFSTRPSGLLDSFCPTRVSQLLSPRSWKSSPFYWWVPADIHTVHHAIWRPIGQTSSATDAGYESTVGNTNSIVGPKHRWITMHPQSSIGFTLWDVAVKPWRGYIWCILTRQTHVVWVMADILTTFDEVCIRTLWNWFYARLRSLFNRSRYLDTATYIVDSVRGTGVMSIRGCNVCQFVAQVSPQRRMCQWEYSIIASRGCPGNVCFGALTDRVCTSRCEFLYLMFWVSLISKYCKSPSVKAQHSCPSPWSDDTSTTACEIR